MGFQLTWLELGSIEVQAHRQVMQEDVIARMNMEKNYGVPVWLYRSRESTQEFCFLCFCFVKIKWRSFDVTPPLFQSLENPLYGIPRRPERNGTRTPSTDFSMLMGTRFIPTVPGTVPIGGTSASNAVR